MPDFDQIENMISVSILFLGVDFFVVQTKCCRVLGIGGCIWRFE
jgi:hypothetical protein